MVQQNSVDDKKGNTKNWCIDSIDYILNFNNTKNYLPNILLVLI